MEVLELIRDAELTTVFVSGKGLGAVLLAIVASLAVLRLGRGKSLRDGLEAIYNRISQGKNG